MTDINYYTTTMCQCFFFFIISDMRSFPPPPVPLSGVVVSVGPLLSLVTAFLSFAPFCMEDSNAPLSLDLAGCGRVPFALDGGVAPGQNLCVINVSKVV